MTTRGLIGTEKGLWALGRSGVTRVEALADDPVTALARQGTRTWAIVAGRRLHEAAADGTWHERAAIERSPEATCLGVPRAGLFVGTGEAHLLRFADGALTPVESFDTAEGRKEWYTPWGDPADVRSITVGRDKAIHVNVHVGGVVRSRDAGATWTPTIDIEADVHQVLAHPDEPRVVLVAAYEGYGVSRDGGDAWAFVNDGMHAHYCRAVAVSDETVLVSASTGPGGRRAAVYRKPFASDAPFEKCVEGLPEWFGDNVDTDCLAARGPVVVIGTEDGRVFRSADSGRRWTLVAEDLPAIRCVSLA